MEIGVHLPTTLPPERQRDGLVTFAREAERREVASLWVSDHVIIPHTTSGSGRAGSFPHPPDRPYIEAVTALVAASRCASS